MVKKYALIGFLVVILLAPAAMQALAGYDWVGLGGSASGEGISNNSGESRGASLALDGNGYPIVAWDDDSDEEFESEIYVRQWNGSAWVEVGTGSASGGGISNNSEQSCMPSLALDGNGYPVVAWFDRSSGNNEIYIRRWNGSAWVAVGTGSASGGGISNNSGDSVWASLALDGNGYPIVAWQDNSGGDEEVYVRRWNGAAWVEVGSGSASGGGISNNGGNSRYPSLALDGSDHPIVAWHDNSGGNYEIYIKRWSGSAWVEVGTGSASGGGISNNSGWSGGEQPGVTGGLSLALDGNDYPVVAWMDDSGGNYEIYIKRWNGSAWVEIGTGSASGGGISNTGGYSKYLSLALDGNGYPVVAWQYWSGLNSETIYVRRWNGSAWVEVSAGSASGGGIGFGCAPSLALDGNGYPVVAWNGGSSGGDDDIYVKRYIGDCDPPTGSIVINSGAIGTSSPSVMLELSANDDCGVSQMQISNEELLVAQASWESYATSKTWTLSGADGLKTVYVQYKDYGGNVSPVYSDTIILDTAVGADYGLSINDGALFTNKVNVTLGLSAISYTVQMMVSNDGGFAGAQWEPYATRKEWQLTQYGEYIILRVVYAKYKDMEGNISSVYQDDIILDVTAPTGSISITPGASGAVAAAGNASVNALAADPYLYPYQIHLPLIMKGLYTPPDLPPNATLHLTAQDDLSGVAEMSFSEDGVGWTLWEAYATTRTWHVAEQGTSTVYVLFRDSAGNVSEAYNASITF